MGIRAGITAAFIVLSLFLSVSAQAAKRVYPQLNGPSESVGGSVSRNAGSLVTTNRLLHGQTILRDPRGPGRFMNLPAQQGSFFSIRGITINAQGMFRRNLPAIVMGGAIAGIGYALDWVFDEADQQWKKEGDKTYTPSDNFHWCHLSYSSCPVHLQGGTPFEAADRYYSDFFGRDITVISTTTTGCEQVNPTRQACRYSNETTSGTKGGVAFFTPRGNMVCDEGTFDSQLGYCVEAEMTPITEADIAQIEPEITGANPEFIQGILRDACNGSNSPDSCFDSLMEKTELSGPSTVTTPSTTSTTTTTGPDGTPATSTTTTNTTFNVTYGPNYYQYNTTTTSTTQKPDGTTETNTETDQETGLPGEEPETPPEVELTYSNPDFPPVEPFYVQKYPDGLAGAWELRKAEIDSSPFFEFLQSFVPSFSGSCPSFQLNMNVMSNAMYGVQNFANLCYVFDFIKAIMMVTALFTARALIFGG